LEESGTPITAELFWGMVITGDLLLIAYSWTLLDDNLESSLEPRPVLVLKGPVVLLNWDLNSLLLVMPLGAYIPLLVFRDASKLALPALTWLSNYF
jgi:hypothetical protein